MSGHLKDVQDQTLESSHLDLAAGEPRFELKRLASGLSGSGSLCEPCPEHAPAKIPMQDGPNPVGATAMPLACLEEEGLPRQEEKTCDAPVDYRGEVQTSPSSPMPSTPLPVPLSKTKLVLLALAMLLTNLTAIGGVVATTMLLPSMARDLNSNLLDMQWAVSAYTLSYGSTLMVSGRLADLYGRKGLFVSGLITAAIFSILSGVIKQRVCICVMRALSGAGLAIAAPAGFGIIGVTFREEPARSYAFATFGLGAPIGVATGTVLAGVVADVGKSGWQYLFYIMAAFSLIPAALGAWIIPGDQRNLRSDAIDRRIDWLGGFLITAGIFLVAFSLTSSGQVARGWREPWVPIMLVVGILLLVAFGFWEHHLERRTGFPPVIRMSLFVRHGWKVTVVVFCAFSISFAIYCFTYTSTLYYQDYLGLSVLDNAWRVMPANCAGFCAAGGIMYLAPRCRAPWLIVVGTVSTGLGFVLYIAEPAHTRYWYCEFWALLLYPIGMDFTICLGNIMISNLVEEHEQSVAGALWQLGMQISGVLGVCASSLIISERQKATGDLLKALKDAWWMQVAFAWLTALVAGIMLRKVRLARDIVPRIDSTHAGDV